MKRINSGVSSSTFNQKIIFKICEKIISKAFDNNGKRCLHRAFRFHFYKAAVFNLDEIFRKLKWETQAFHKTELLTNKIQICTRNPQSGNHINRKNFLIKMNSESNLSYSYSYDRTRQPRRRYWTIEHTQSFHINFHFIRTIKLIQCTNSKILATDYGSSQNYKYFAIVPIIIIFLTFLIKN